MPDGPEDVATWVSAKKAVELLIPRLKHENSCQDTIIGRAALSLVASRCLCFARNTGGGDDLQYINNVRIDPGFWADIGDSRATYQRHWNSGDFSTKVNTRKGPRVQKAFGVQFLLSDLTLISDQDDAAHDSARLDSTKLQKISDEHLKAWFDFYKRVISPSSDTEEGALEHARMCFPKGAIGRESVRKLRGAQKRGPKPTAK